METVETPWGTGKIIPAEMLVSGKQLFYLMDSCGLSLDYLLEELEDRGLVVNALEFIEAALLSKNYSVGSLKTKMHLQANMPESLFDVCVFYLLEQKINGRK